MSQLAGFAAFYFSLKPTFLLFVNGQLLMQYFAFLDARHRQPATKLIAARHGLRLVRFLCMHDISFTFRITKENCQLAVSRRTYSSSSIRHHARRRCGTASRRW